MTGEIRKAVEAAETEFECALVPAAPEWLVGRVTVLLTHFYVAQIAPEVQAAVIDDWVEALSRFPQWAVEQAVADYLAEEDRRPTIAAIAGRCEAEISQPKTQLDAMRILLRQPALARPAPTVQEAPPVKVASDA